jgi:hypothetical protein
MAAQFPFGFIPGTFSKRRLSSIVQGDRREEADHAGKSSAGQTAGRPARAKKRRVKEQKRYSTSRSALSVPVTFSESVG